MTVPVFQIDPESSSQSLYEQWSQSKQRVNVHGFRAHFRDNQGCVFVCYMELRRANFPVDTLLPRQNVIRSRQLTGGVRDQLETALSLAGGVEQTPLSSSRTHSLCGRTGGRQRRITCESLFLASHACPHTTMVSLSRLLYRKKRRFTNKQVSLFMVCTRHGVCLILTFLLDLFSVCLKALLRRLILYLIIPPAWHQQHSKFCLSTCPELYTRRKKMSQRERDTRQ